MEPLITYFFIKIFSFYYLFYIALEFSDKNKLTVPRKFYRKVVVDIYLPSDNRVVLAKKIQFRFLHYKLLLIFLLF